MVGRKGLGELLGGCSTAALQAAGWCWARHCRSHSICRQNHRFWSLDSPASPSMVPPWWLMQGEGHRHLCCPVSPQTGLTALLMTALWLARKASHDSALGHQVLHPFPGDKSLSPTLAPGSLCIHTPVLIQEGSVLQVPPLPVSFHVGNLLLVREKGTAASSASPWFVWQLYWYDTRRALAGIAGRNRALVVPKAINVHITLNPSSVIMLSLHLLGLLYALPGLLQLLSERS